MKDNRDRGGVEMFQNIGGKIKLLGKIVAWTGIIFSLVIGVIFIVVGMDLNVNAGVAVGIGVFILVFGPIVSWISSFMLVGFGELIEKVNEIAKNAAIVGRE